jgi:hypothetical protein
MVGSIHHPWDRPDLRNSISKSSEWVGSDRDVKGRYDGGTKANLD